MIRILELGNFFARNINKIAYQLARNINNKPKNGAWTKREEAPEA